MSVRADRQFRPLFGVVVPARRRVVTTSLEGSTPRWRVRALPNSWTTPASGRKTNKFSALSSRYTRTSRRRVRRLCQSLAVGGGLGTQLTSEVEPEWRQRPPRRRLLRPLVPTVPAASVHGRRPRADAVWDDRAEHDADQLVALLFVAGASLRRAEAAEMLRMSQPRLARACGVLRADPPRGLRLEEAGEQLTLVSAPHCAATVRAVSRAAGTRAAVAGGA